MGQKQLWKEANRQRWTFAKEMDATDMEEKYKGENEQDVDAPKTGVE
jgi:hypothetical protein